MLGASTGSARFADMRKLLDWGFAHYRTQKLVSDAAPIGVVAVGRSGDATVSVRAAEPYSVLETIGAEPATVRVILPPSVPTSVWRGQQLGTAEVSRSGSVIATVPLLAEAAVCDPAAARPMPASKPPVADAERQRSAAHGARIDPRDGATLGEPPRHSRRHAVGRSAAASASARM